VTDIRTNHLLRWGWGLTSGSLLFAPLAIPAAVIGVILLTRDRIAAGVAVILGSIALAFVSVQVGLEIIRQTNKIEQADLHIFEGEVGDYVERTMGAQVDRTVCARSGDFEAKCSALLTEGGRVRYVVTVDGLDGSWSSEYAGTVP
jgi:hypothetical protein